MPLYKLTLSNVNHFCKTEFVLFSMDSVKKIISRIPAENVPTTIYRMSSSTRWQKIEAPKVKSHPQKEDMAYVEVQYIYGRNFVKVNMYVPKNQDLTESILWMINENNNSNYCQCQVVSVKEVAEQDLTQGKYYYYGPRAKKKGKEVLNFKRKVVETYVGFRKDCEDRLREFVRNTGSCLFREKNIDYRSYDERCAENTGDGHYRLIENGNEIGFGTLCDVIEFLCDENYYDLLDLNNVIVNDNK